MTDTYLLSRINALQAKLGHAVLTMEQITEHGARPCDLLDCLEAEDKARRFGQTFESGIAGELPETAFCLCWVD